MTWPNRNNSPDSNPSLDAALQPAEPNRDQSGPPPPAVEPTLSGDAVARTEMPEGFAQASSRVSTTMTAPADLEGAAFEERSIHTARTTDVSSDRTDGPTHQPGVVNDAAHNPDRTPLGRRGVPGDGKERDLPTTDLYVNRHPEGDAFDSQASTVGRPLAEGEPEAANRSLPLTAGEPLPEIARPQDVPAGSAARPNAGEGFGAQGARSS